MPNFVHFSAITAEGKPMLSSDDSTSFTPVAGTLKHLYAYGAKNVLSQLFLIPLHPERLSFQYGNVFEDEDGTKVFEKSSTVTTQAARVQNNIKNNTIIPAVVDTQEPINENDNNKWSRVWGTKFGPLKSLLHVDYIGE
jgi:hypothetical protein